MSEKFWKHSRMDSPRDEGAIRRMQRAVKKHKHFARVARRKLLHARRQKGEEE